MRLIITTEKTPPLIFWDRRGLGTIPWLTNQLSNLAMEAIHGPDALAITGLALHNRIHSSRRHIKVALLDQKILAGVGNIYASEIPP